MIIVNEAKVDNNKEAIKQSIRHDMDIIMTAFRIYEANGIIKAINHDPFNLQNNMNKLS
ncbi:hypothetical protein [Bacillus sp. FJAT-22090]|uniref:hypothetical protein n=1 Tax=Bacillus sp. FJAT-22090 TaxID=1581038 RepID=UPI0016424EA6|nr:hypothetical protein [Bacillus sp. FJAT-22090]